MVILQREQHSMEQPPRSVGLRLQTWHCWVLSRLDWIWGSDIVELIASNSLDSWGSMIVIGTAEIYLLGQNEFLP